MLCSILVARGRKHFSSVSVAALSGLRQFLAVLLLALHRSLPRLLLFPCAPIHLQRPARARLPLSIVRITPVRLRLRFSRARVRHPQSLFLAARSILRSFFRASLGFAHRLLGRLCASLGFAHRLLDRLRARRS